MRRRSDSGQRDGVTVFALAWLTLASAKPSLELYPGIRDGVAAKQISAVLEICRLEIGALLSQIPFHSASEAL